MRHAQTRSEANASQRGRRLKSTRAPVAAARGNGLAPYPLATTGASYRDQDNPEVVEMLFPNRFFGGHRPPLQLPGGLNGRACEVRT